MYKLSWFTVDEHFNGVVFGQVIPMTRYNYHIEKTKNKDIKNKTDELLQDKSISSISFWKYPTRKNSLISVTHSNGEIAIKNWESPL